MNWIFRLCKIPKIFMLLICYHSFGQQKSDYTNQIDSLIKTTSIRPFNGVVIIAQKGKINYAKAFGYTNLNTKQPLKIDDRFSTMSIAKQVTATLILQEMEKGNIDLYTPIRKYLPDLKYHWADTITLHNLLNHTSGLQSESLDEPLKFSTGKGFSYSNIGYALAGQVLEKVAHKNYEQLVTALFQKCDIKNSGYPTVKNQQKLVKGHSIKKDNSITVRKEITFKPNYYFGSHLIVTAKDLVMWNECLL